MRAILIDSKARIVRSVEHDGSLENIYKLLNCRTFTAPIELENGDTVFCDDEGLLGNPRDFFELDGYEPIAGNALILGTTKYGESVSCKSTIVEIDSDVNFIDIATLTLRYRLAR